MSLHGNNDFLKISENLGRYSFENSWKNNYIGNSNMTNTVTSFDILPINLDVLHNYFENPIKLFSDPYLAKFLNTLAELLSIIIYYYCIFNC